MGRMMGTIALLQGDRNVGRLLQLRVAPEWKSKPAVARILVGAAIDEAKTRGAMKVIIESPDLEVPGAAPGDSPIIKYLRSLGFEHTRRRSTDGRSMLEFYLNLYDDPSMTAGSNEMPRRP
jgi:ribosomal protein S18 acetylase RimI-like enzyme